MAPHSSTLAWKIPWTEEPGGLQSMGSLGVGHDWVTSLSLFTLEKEMATHSSILAWRIPGTGEPGGLPSMGSHRVGHDWSNLAASVYPWVDKRRRRVVGLQSVEACSPKVYYSFNKCMLGLGYHWSYGEQAPCPHAASILVWREEAINV